MRLFKLFIALFLFGTAVSQAQDEQVRTYLQMIARGQEDDVKSKMLDLLAEYPDNPGVQMLHAVLIEDGYKAVNIYKRLVSKHPQSEWADDAYWRIIQFYAVKGEADKALRELQNFRREYPNSEYLMPATDIVNTAARYGSGGHTVINDRQEPAKGRPARQEEPVQMADSGERGMTNIPEEMDDVEPIEPAPANTGHYGLQVGIYSSKSSAEAEMKKFLNKRMRTEVTEKNIEGERMYAVVIGDYSSRESAEAAKVIVEQQCDCEPIIYQK
ncbi:MAG: SPOR domain-containing protein [Candidatus Kapaibacterium sp.]